MNRKGLTRCIGNLRTVKRNVKAPAQNGTIDDTCKCKTSETALPARFLPDTISLQRVRIKSFSTGNQRSLQPLLSPLDTILAGRADKSQEKIMERRTKLFSLLFLAVVTCAMLLPTNASAALTGVPVTGTFTDSSGGTGQFVGTFNPQRFGVQSGKLVAIGTLVGNMTSSTGAALGSVTSANTAVPVSAASASCAILSLNLGPLHLNLLGLVVTLNEVHLNITAVSGPGNLLGNLLCSIANLLNGGAADIGTLSTLLNDLLAAL
jgi:hypothetical protein